MPTFLNISIPLYSFLIMFTVGTGLTLANFRHVAGTRRPLILASLLQTVYLPLAGLTDLGRIKSGILRIIKTNKIKQMKAVSA